MTALASSFIGMNEKSGSTREILNCLRLLQRILPVVFEVDGDSSTFELEVLWKRQPVEAPQAERTTSGPETPQFVIESDDEDNDGSEGSKQPSTPVSSSEATRTLGPSLGERLLNASRDLLFTRGFTLPPKSQTSDPKVDYTIWYVATAISTEKFNFWHQGKRYRVYIRLWCHT